LSNDLGEKNWLGDFWDHWAIFSQKHLVTLTFVETVDTFIFCSGDWATVDILSVGNLAVGIGTVCHS
jgi:hypothetical protein